MCWDVTCVDTLGQSIVSQCIIEAGSAAKDVKAHKRNGSLQRSQKHIIEPIAVESTGGGMHCLITLN